MSVLKRECSTSNGSTLYLHMSQWDPSAETLTISNTSEYDTEKFELRPDWELKYELQYGPNVSCTTMVVDLPKDMRFNEDIVISVVAYTCMFLVSLVGNAMVFTTLWSSRRSRVNMCILHLSVADLFIACVFLPLETSWHITVSWRAGDLACRICMLFRAFGFYLSSHITMVIAIDRCMSIVQPLMMNGAFRRCRILLLIAYLLSFIFSLPQSIIFHVEQHPVFPWFSQCVTFNFFQSESEELAYDIFNCVAVYALPLVVIATAYTLILLKLSRQQNKHVKGTSLSKRKLWRKKSSSSLTPTMTLLHQEETNIGAVIRCSTTQTLSKAKMTALKLTSCIVAAFLICWAPYFSVILYHWMTKDTEKQLDTRTQRILFIFAVSNSCFDPIIYGMFTTTFRKRFSTWKYELIQKFCGSI